MISHDRVLGLGCHRRDLGLGARRHHGRDHGEAVTGKGQAGFGRGASSPPFFVGQVLGKGWSRGSYPSHARRTPERAIGPDWMADCRAGEGPRTAAARRAVQPWPDWPTARDGPFVGRRAGARCKTPHSLRAGNRRRPLIFITFPRAILLRSTRSGTLFLECLLFFFFDISDFKGGQCDINDTPASVTNLTHRARLGILPNIRVWPTSPTYRE